MAEFLYDPADELGPIEKGDFVEVVDSQGAVRGNAIVKRVGARVVTTRCGRRWTRSHGEWVSECPGGRPVSWPFPSIRKVPSDPRPSKAAEGA